MLHTPQDPTRDWCLLRLDDNGNEFVVSRDHSQAEALSLAQAYQARGHKQLYWAQRCPGAKPSD
ncbi:hypothetical protein [Pseudomonas sp. 2FE]|uniref:hypothetical protein n=1 Tax=Pseudomonas sp. 2FE TaxID=2502190 RepID=UPI0010F9E1B6|nr:hypothetical protein [Pseudomonas sp. 2FE]